MTGCSSGKNPVTPDELPASQDPAISALQSNHTALLGYFDIYFDSETRIFEAVVNRHAGYSLNIVPFLNMMEDPLFGIEFVNLSFGDDLPGRLDVHVGFKITHPFAGVDQYNVYDLLGVVIADGHRTLSNQGFKVARHGTDLYMKNPDGFTRWFNPTEFTTELIFGYAPGGYQNYAGNATLNTYKYYALGHSSEDTFDFLAGEENNHGLFESGWIRNMRLEFILPPDGEGLSFGYAMVAAWEEQGPSGPYYPVHHNEALACHAEIADTVWYETGGSGGDLEIDFSLFAWEHQPDTIRIESTVIDGVSTFDADSIGTLVNEYVTSYHVQIPAKADLQTYKDHDVWIFAEYEDFDYSNDFPDIPHAAGNLTAVFRFPVLVSTSDPEYDFYVTNHMDFIWEEHEGYGTMEHPFFHLSDALKYADPGDIIAVDAGAFPHAGWNFMDSRYDDITIKAVNWYSASGRPGIEGQFILLNFRNSRNITIEGFKIFCDASVIGGSSLIYIYKCEDITFRDCLFTSTGVVKDSYTKIFNVVSSENIIISNCLIKDIQIEQDWGDSTIFNGIRLWNSSCTVTKNELTNFTVLPGGSIDMHGIFAIGPEDDTVIENNLIHHFYGGTEGSNPLTCTVSRSIMRNLISLSLTILSTISISRTASILLTSRSGG